MELNFPPWLFTWNQFFFMFYVFVAVFPAAVLLCKNNERVLAAKPGLFFHVVGKVGLDIALVMGISGSAIALMGSLQNFNPDIDPYFQATYIVGTMIFGAGVTGASYCLHYKQLKEPLIYKLERQQAKKLAFVISGVVLAQMYICNINFFDLWKFGWMLIFQSIVFSGWAVLGGMSGKPPLRCLIESNISVTFFFLAMGIVFWFAEGGDYLNSRNNIFVVARTLFVGALLHVILYYISLSRDESHLGDYKTKTWHFAEASSFVVFLILAPVGLTEYSRESTDQISQQANNKAQGIRIEELEAQIKLLTEKIEEI